MSSGRARRSRLGLLTVAALLLLGLAYVGVLEANRPHVDGERLRFDTLVSLAGTGRLKTATVLDQDAYVVGEFVDAQGRVGRYNSPLLTGTQSELLERLLRAGIPIDVDQQVGKRVVSLAGYLLPGLILVVAFVYLILSYRRGTGLFGITSGARRVKPESIDVTFSDVAGQDEAVDQLRQLTAFLADPTRFEAVGAMVPTGALLYGPPGCGKTLLARALAAEAGASFFSISGSDFVELYQGVGASRVRELFRQARQSTPALVFVDELDAIGRSRADDSPGASREQEQALTQLLAEMDGFSSTSGIIVLAATNRPDVLDPALLRPGRFDRTIGLELPDEPARASILRLHARTRRLDPDVDLESLAARSIGLTGADLSSLLNEAALTAVGDGRSSIRAADADGALGRILAAPEHQRRLSLRPRSVGRRFAGDERVTFDDVAGLDEAVAELGEATDFLARPGAFASMGARPPRGILVSGPPGCGKTLLARAVAGQANAAFVSVSGSDFVEVFAGEGASRVRELFADARAMAPAIVFVDEIDAIGARRGVTADGNREREQTLNQILVELDGFDARSSVLVMAATNRPDILDPALVRPGRFDRHVALGLPDQVGRIAILALQSRGKPMGADVELEMVARLCRGFSGAELANVLNEAAILATRKGLDHIPMTAVEESVDRVALGAVGGPRLSEQDRRIVAVHEAGHAMVALALPGIGAPHRVTVAPRAGALGRCTVVDLHDRALATTSALRDRLVVLLAGRAAELMVLGESSSAVVHDLRQASALARELVCELGGSEAAGAVFVEPGSDLPADQARLIGVEVRALVDNAGARAASLLAEQRSVLDLVITALVERESLSRAELVAIAGSLEGSASQRSRP